MRRCLPAVLWLATVAAGQTTPNLLVNPGFEAGDQAWQSMGGSYHRVVPGLGRDGSAALRYEKAPGPAVEGENCHLDQVVRLAPGQPYLAGLWLRSAGDLRPVLRIAGGRYETLAAAMAGPGTDWQPAQVFFRAPTDGLVRFQIFGGSLTERRETAPGSSLADDAWLRAPSDEELAAALRVEATIHADRPLGSIDRRFFGVNSLNWIETDAARADGRLAARLRELPCGLLRFPGGEVADNYHWQTHRLDDPRQWPAVEGPEVMDTAEFVTWCRAIGAEPIFVVNLESSARRGDLDAGAREAAAWVAHCNRERGYGIRYWEIGNETYLAGTYQPLTAQAYGEAFARFVRAMKAVDPTIQCGAVGPLGPRDVSRLDRESNGPAWWPTVLAEGRELVDFVVIHRYLSLDAASPGEPLAETVARPTRELRALLQERYPGRHTPVALTEWNTARTEAEPFAHALAIAEMTCGWLEGGVDWACFWPLRLPREGGFRALLHHDTFEPRPAWLALQALAQHLIGAQRVPVEATNRRLTVLAALADDGSLRVVAVNRGPDPVPLRLRGFAPARASARAWLAAGGEPRWLDLTASGEVWGVPPASLVLLTAHR